VVVGAHYDSHGNIPAADDNASGVAAVLALARAYARERPGPERTLRFVFFVNEEPPFFQTDAMGSRVYARRCRARGETIVAMLSLETVGYYCDRSGSQNYPFPLSAFYPSRGDFIGFVGDLSSRRLVKRVVDSFRRHAMFPSQGAALPSGLRGVGWSDQWSFWQEGYPAVMCTDTAPFRNPNYHTPRDTPDTLDFDRMARVVEGLTGVVRELTRVGSE
jgi:Zn-dependent M28 family amino/carboxypeptidase